MTFKVKIFLILSLLFVGVASVCAQQRFKIVGGKRVVVADTTKTEFSQAVKDSLFVNDSLYRSDSLARLNSAIKKDSNIVDTAFLKKDHSKAKKSPELALLNAELAKRERFKLTRDTIAPGALVALSLIPGMGQVYNKQYWKIPVYWAAGGAFLAAGLITDKKYKTYKTQWQEATSLSMPREITDPLERRMRQEGTNRTIFYALAGATYLYQLADATYNYRGYQNPVRTSTILAALFPGAGFVYTKTYWRLPIYYGGFIALATVIDYNQRSYDRYNNAYEAVLYGHKDEFNGRYSAEVLRNAKDGYRRNRDLGIIALVGAYALSIIDTYVIATLKNWDVSQDLSIKVAPTLFEDQVYRATYKPQSYGMSLKITF